MDQHAVLKKAPGFRYAVFFMMLLGYIFAYGGLQIIAAQSNVVMSAMGIEEGRLTLAASICSVTMGIFAGVAGALNSKFGGKKTLVGGLLIMALAGAMFLMQPGSLFILCVIRLVQGVGTGMVSATVLTLTAVWFPKNQRGIAQGLLACFYGASLSLVTVYTYSCNEAGLTWYNTCGYALAVVGIVLALVVGIFYKDIEKKYGVSIIDEAIEGYVPEKLGAESDSGNGNIAKPKNWSEALRFPGFWILGFTLFFYDTSAIGAGTIFPLFLTHCGFNAADATRIMSLGTLGTLVFSLLGGLLSDKILKSKRTPVTMIAFGGAALFFLIIVGCATKVPIPVLIVLYFIAYGLLNSSGGPSWVLPAEIVAPEFAQQNVGINLFFSSTGGFVMITIIGFIVSATNATVGIVCLAISMILTFIGAFIIKKKYNL